MNNLQELEWLEAQCITISMDLVAAAQRQLQFLEVIDKTRCLYDGPTLEKAIYRYKTCWLPLLAKYASSSGLNGPLVVPLDCEWIWHCHRLNPVQYKLDCHKFYWRLLDSKNVASSLVQGTSAKETQEIWNSLFPSEPYELDFSIPPKTDVDHYSKPGGITYDLVSAVKRQSSFYYQVSRAHMHDSMFLEGAVARYRGFLHLIKRNREKSLRRFCVPTYDIDLIWHSHQLQPASYSKDLITVIGKVLEHDDTDTDRSKGKKLDTGFIDTTKQWEDTFGLRYWRAGAMYRGSAPSPVTDIPWPSKSFNKSVTAFNTNEKKLQLKRTQIVEICLEFVGVRNISSGHKGQLFISIGKSQPDLFLNAERRLTIFSESSSKQVTVFQCEPEGYLSFTLMSKMQTNSTFSKGSTPIGTMSFPLKKYIGQESELSIEKWFNLTPHASELDPHPISLHVAISLTVPTAAPYMLKMVKSDPSSDDITSFFPVLEKVQPLRKGTCVMDSHDNEIIYLQTRTVKKGEEKRREIVGIFKDSSEAKLLAEWNGTEWAIMNCHWFLQLETNSERKSYLVNLRGEQPVKLFLGRRLEFEENCYNSPKKETNFMTIIGFSSEDPYGKALALIDMESNHLKVNEEQFALPAMILSYILSNIYKKEGCNIIVTDETTYNAQNDKTHELGNSDLVSLYGGSCGKCGGGCGGGGRCGNGGGGGGCGGGRCSGCGSFSYDTSDKSSGGGSKCGRGLTGHAFCGVAADFAATAENTAGGAIVSELAGAHCIDMAATAEHAACFAVASDLAGATCIDAGEHF